MYIWGCMGSNFCAKFQRAPLKFHTKFWIHTPQNMHFTVLYFCVWVTISLNCDVISLSETGPSTDHDHSSGKFHSQNAILKFVLTNQCLNHQTNHSFIHSKHNSKLPKVAATQSSYLSYDSYFHLPDINSLPLRIDNLIFISDQTTMSGYLFAQPICAVWCWCIIILHILQWKTICVSVFTTAVIKETTI